MNISVPAMYPEIWGADLPKSQQKLSPLCRLASVDELNCYTFLNLTDNQRGKITKSFAQDEIISCLEVTNILP